MRMNCWEAKKCGREPGGDKAQELGICPAAVATSLHGTNSGINGGRACWSIAKTLCDGRIQGTFTQKLSGCLQCDFYSSVRNEEQGNYTGTKQILSQLRGHAEFLHNKPKTDSYREGRML